MSRNLEQTLSSYYQNAPTNIGSVILKVCGLKMGLAEITSLRNVDDLLVLLSLIIVNSQFMPHYSLVTHESSPVTVKCACSCTSSSSRCNHQRKQLQHQHQLSLSRPRCRWRRGRSWSSRQHRTRRRAPCVS